MIHLKKVLDSRYFLWALLALPSVPALVSLLEGASGRGSSAINEAIHHTGEFAAYFMIIAMLLSPLLLLFPRSSLLWWLMRRRRYFGVAAFSYAAAHAVLYLIDLGSLREVLGQFLTLGIWTGWAALFLFIPLTITSNNISVRLLGPRWKSVHQLTYVAAVAVLLHWVFVNYEIVPALIFFLPLAVLEAYRFWYILSKGRLRTPVKH